MGDSCEAPVFDSLGSRLNAAARAARSLLDARLADAGTTAATWFILVRLEAFGPLIQRDLAGKLQIEGPTLVRHLDRMEAQGLVTRSPSPSDRRATLVTLTAKGREQYRTIRARVEAVDEELAASLTRQQRRVLEAALPLLAARARELHPRNRG